MLHWKLRLAAAAGLTVGLVGALALILGPFNGDCTGTASALFPNPTSCPGPDFVYRQLAAAFFVALAMLSLVVLVYSLLRKAPAREPVDATEK